MCDVPAAVGTLACRSVDITSPYLDSCLNIVTVSVADLSVFGLPPDPDPLVRCTDPVADLDPSIIKQK